MTPQCGAGYHVLCRAYRAGLCGCRCHATVNPTSLAASALSTPPVEPGDGAEPAELAAAITAPPLCTTAIAAAGGERPGGCEHDETAHDAPEGGMSG